MLPQAVADEKARPAWSVCTIDDNDREMAQPPMPSR